MKSPRILLYLFLSLILIKTHAKETQSTSSVNTSVTLSKAIDYHITSPDQCIGNNVVINLTHEDAWLFFDNVKPSDVIDQWLPQIKVDGEAISPQENCWVSLHGHGTVLIPQSKDFEPLTAYTGELYTGDSKSYKLGKYVSLGIMDNKIKSFKLKRGYMATLAQDRNGSGYSRVFIAQDKDIEIPNLLDKASCTNGGALYNKISFIRVMRMQMPEKKGSVWDGDSKKLDCTWYYHYSIGTSADYNREFVPMFHHVGWNSFAGAGAAPETSGVTHTLGFNEPWNPSDQGYMGTDPLAPISHQYDAVITGHRIGSMAPTDGNFGKLYAFIDECDRLGLRCDFVAIHIYQWQSADWWYNKSKEVYQRTGRPVWITEWNNGANWTGEWWPGTLNEQWTRQRNQIAAVCAKLNEAPWVERYAIYNAVTLKRNVISQEDTVATIDGVTKRYNKGDLTPAGETYNAMNTPLAYNSDYEFIPVYPQFQEPTVSIGTSLLLTMGRIQFTITESNGEYFDKYVIEKKTGKGDYEIIKEGSVFTFADTYDKEHPQNVSYRTSFYYCNETTPRFTKEQNIDVNIAKDGILRYGSMELSKPDWAYILFNPTESKSALPFFGAAPNTVLSGEGNQFTCILNPSIGVNNFRAKVVPWGYLYEYDESKLNNLEYSNAANIPYIIADTTATSLQEHPVEAGIIRGVTNEWRQVNFKKAFERTPVVFPTLTSHNNLTANRAPVFPRIRNVTKEGFEIQITRESKLGTTAWAPANENAGYYAITPGHIKITEQSDTLHIVVECTPEVNGTLIQSTTTKFPVTCSEKPLLLSAMQSSNDNATSVLTYSSLSDSSVHFYKVRERSVSGSLTGAKESVGYMLFYHMSSPTCINSVESNSNNLTLYQKDHKLFIEGTPDMQVTIYTLNGIKVLSANATGGIETTNLQAGYYILRTEDGKSARFVKK